MEFGELLIGGVMMDKKPQLDKYTSYEGYSQGEEPAGEELIDTLYEQYTEQFVSTGIPDITVLSFREYLQSCVRQLQNRIDVDIPEKRRRLIDTPLIVVTKDVTTINQPSREDLQCAEELCKVSIQIIERYLRKGDSIIKL